MALVLWGKGPRVAMPRLLRAPPFTVKLAAPARPSSILSMLPEDQGPGLPDTGVDDGDQRGTRARRFSPTRAESLLEELHGFLRVQEPPSGRPAG